MIREFGSVNVIIITLRSTSFRQRDEALIFFWITIACRKLPEFHFYFRSLTTIITTVLAHRCVLDIVVERIFQLRYCFL